MVRFCDSARAATRRDVVVFGVPGPVRGPHESYRAHGLALLALSMGLLSVDSRQAGCEEVHTVEPHLGETLQDERRRGGRMTASQPALAHSQGICPADGVGFHVTCAGMEWLHTQDRVMAHWAAV